MTVHVFPGQGAQFSGMGKELFSSNSEAAALFTQANEILDFDLSSIMFEGTQDELGQTKVTQPAVFVHSVVAHKILAQSKPDMVAGHSLGEFSALVAAGVLSFEDGLRLVSERALAMQAACETNPSTMAAILGLSDEQVEEGCSQLEEVFPANYNCPGQLVISGSKDGIAKACDFFKSKGAKRALPLSVSGAFHSPYMLPASERLEQAIHATTFKAPECAVYQNVDARPHTNPEDIKSNLTAQLTGAVRWTQSVQNMISDGASSFTEYGPGKVLQGLIKKIDRGMHVESQQ